MLAAEGDGRHLDLEAVEVEDGLLRQRQAERPSATPHCPSAVMRKPSIETVGQAAAAGGARRQRAADLNRGRLAGAVDRQAGEVDGADAAERDRQCGVRAARGAGDGATWTPPSKPRLTATPTEAKSKKGSVSVPAMPPAVMVFWTKVRSGALQREGEAQELGGEVAASEYVRRAAEATAAERAVGDGEADRLAVGRSQPVGQLDGWPIGERRRRMPSSKPAARISGGDDSRGEVERDTGGREDDHGPAHVAGAGVE